MSLERMSIDRSVPRSVLAGQARGAPPGIVVQERCAEMAKKLIVIGGVAAGPKAAAKTRRCDPEMEIVLY